MSDRPPVGMRLAGFALGLAVLAALLVWVLPGWLDWGRYRGAISRFAAGELGRPVVIDGPISVVLLPAPLLVAGDVRLGDRGDGISLTAPAMRLALRVAPLLRGRLVPRELVLSRPRITLPWPLPPAALGVDLLEAGSARIERGMLRIGELTVSNLTADVLVGRQVAGSAQGGLVVRGKGQALGLDFRFEDRLGGVDEAGNAPFEAMLDAMRAARQDSQGKTPGAAGGNAATGAPVTQPATTTVHFVGTLDHAGALAGHVTAHDDDLSRLLPAPAVAATLEGSLGLGAGLARAELTLSAGAIRARAVLGPAAASAAKAVAGGQVLAVRFGRIDLDEWLRAWRQSRRAVVRAEAKAAAASRAAPGLPWPIDIECAVDAVQWHGALIRDVHAALDVGREGGVSLRSARATLPGDAQLRLGGRLVLGDAPSLAATAQLAAPQLRATLDWLRAAGLRLGLPASPDVLRTAMLDFHLAADRERVEINAIAGKVDDTPVSGRVGIDAASGAIDAELAVDHLVLDDWLAGAPDGAVAPAGTDGQAWPGWGRLSASLARTDLALKLRVQRLAYGGLAFGNLAADLATRAGGLAVNGADADFAGTHLHVAGTLTASGELDGAAFDLAGAHAAELPAALPGWARFTQGFWAGPIHLHAEASGPVSGLIGSVALDLADMRLEAHPVIDLGHASWTSPLALRHPGAQRLLAGLGFAATRAWLGDGSLSVLAHGSGGPGRLVVSGLDVTAAALHAAADLALDWNGAVPVLSGSVAADTVPLPPLDPTSHDVLALGWMRGLDAHLALTAARVATEDEVALREVRARIDLAGGKLSLGGLQGVVAGGTMQGAATLDAASVPPRATLALGLAGMVLPEPDSGAAQGGNGALGLAGGTLDATLALNAQGNSLAALLVSLAGTAKLHGAGTALLGLDVPGAVAASADLAAQIATALNGGRTRIATLDMEMALAEGVATIWQGAATVQDMAQPLALTGSIDLPRRRLDVSARLPDGRALRVTGPIAAPKRMLAGASS